MATQAPLKGLKVIDVATIFAGPISAMLLGDFGADVIKVEHPRGDAARTHGDTKDGIGLWWKLISRNKKCVTLDLKTDEGRELFLDLVEDADVVIENFRPGTLERWGLGYEQLSERNPGLILARVTGFGQFGPMRDLPGFGTLAESMSSFAHHTGEADGPPILPPLALSDTITALATSFAVMSALRAREAIGRGQVIDVAIIEPILTFLGPAIMAYDQLGIEYQRTGNRSRHNAPRNLYLTADGRWVGIATTALSIAERVMRLVGRPDLIDEPWFSSARGRAEHTELLDEVVGSWIGERSTKEVVDAFEEAEAAVAPVNDITDVMVDPQYEALNSIITIEDADFGPLKMQNVMFRLSETPGEVKWTGPGLGQHNEEVYGELGVSKDRLDHLKSVGVI